MSRGIKIWIAVVGIVIVLPVIGIVTLVVGLSLFERPPMIRPYVETPLANHGTLIVGGEVRGRSEHSTAQKAGYRPSGSSEIEWFGDVCDGVEPQVYLPGGLVVVIDAPSACLFVRNAKSPAAWKTLALVFPNDLGPFPISYYADQSGLTLEEVSRINDLGDKRQQKYPTTYIQSFDPVTRDLQCAYHVDNKSSWPLHLRLSEDGTHLALVEIGSSSP
jgi:hypothetical protein